MLVVDRVNGRCVGSSYQRVTINGERYVRFWNIEAGRREALKEAVFNQNFKVVDYADYERPNTRKRIRKAGSGARSRKKMGYFHKRQATKGERNND